jgi:predicted protein tyrosine phosphatase
MTRFPKITICGVDELDGHDLGQFTHVISIWDPVWETRNGHQAQFRRRFSPASRVHFSYFDDIPAPMDARFAPSFEQIRKVLEFARTIEASSTVLIHCWAGISRSTAVAYAVLCQFAGPGQEAFCLGCIREIRPRAVPNSLIVTLAEIALGRDGSMFAAYENMISRMLISCDDEEL